ncbi:MAG: RNA polymerase sigma factor RpoH [Betaproteobacteria bacterium]|nr:RNA polymerase sigma factor RpoH [Betaproteobacteria bacterium]MCC6250475.1 RNA polymerase sigma factor RpoH [Rubrivivax sp.]
MNHIAAASTSGSTALAVRDPWSLVPSLGNLDAYISAVNRLPMLTQADESALARRLRDSGDLAAAGQLVLSHLRLVVSVSRQYLGYGLPQGDLIQEGNVGLMKAVKRFDPEQGVRLVSYALHWIKAEIHEYILKNWRMVKVATTKAQRKLFFNLRSMKARMKGQRSEGAAAGAQGLPAEGETYRNTLTPAEVAAVARELNVKPEEVIEMETRMAGGDVALEPQGDDDDEAAFAPIAYLADESNEPTRRLEADRRDRLAADGIGQALDVLDARSRRIVEQRWLAVNDDSSGGMTLHELAAEYGVSAERIRQIEVAALKKMRKALEPAAA